MTLIYFQAITVKKKSPHLENNVKAFFRFQGHDLKPPFRMMCDYVYTGSNPCVSQHSNAGRSKRGTSFRVQRDRTCFGA
jgi:hypothetical protein